MFTHTHTKEKEKKGYHAQKIQMNSYAQKYVRMHFKIQIRDIQHWLDNQVAQIDPINIMLDI